MSDRNPAKRGQEINGFNAKVVVAMDVRLHESLCRLAQRRRASLASVVREELRGIGFSPCTDLGHEKYWPQASRSLSILTIEDQEGSDGALS
jgi:hypothetical protein